MSPFPFGNWKNWNQSGEITDPKSGVRQWWSSKASPWISTRRFDFLLPCLFPCLQNGESGKSCLMCNLEIKLYPVTDAESVLICIMWEVVAAAGEHADSIVCVSLGAPLGWMMDVGSPVSSHRRLLTGSDQTLTKAAKPFLGQETQSTFVVKNIYYKPACEP